MTAYNQVLVIGSFLETVSHNFANKATNAVKRHLNPTSTDKVVARVHCVVDRPGQTNYFCISCILACEHHANPGLVVKLTGLSGLSSM